MIRLIYREIRQINLKIYINLIFQDFSLIFQHFEPHRTEPVELFCERKEVCEIMGMTHTPAVYETENCMYSMSFINHVVISNNIWSEIFNETPYIYVSCKGNYNKGIYMHLPISCYLLVEIVSVDEE